MSPDLLALARAYMALPGAPTMTETLLSYGVGAKCYRRDSAGVLWIDGAPENASDYEWLPDLTDDATGGVMLGMLGSAAWRVTRRHPAGDGSPWYADLYLSARKPGSVVPEEFYGAYCATLAEACARVAVALGRAA